MSDVEHGVLLSHASEEVYDDLVGPTFETAAARDDYLYRVLRASAKATRVSRAPGGEWQDRRGRTAAQALRQGVESNFRGWL